MTAAFDYQRIDYSGAKSVGNPSMAIVIGDTAPIFPGGGVERIRMYQNSFGIAWNYKFQSAESPGALLTGTHVPRSGAPRAEDYLPSAIPTSSAARWAARRPRE